MFIKVMFGAGCSVLVNTSCRLVNLTAHLRQKAGLPPDVSLHVLPATIALLAEDGNLVSLEEDLKEGASRAQTMGNSLLKERAIYVLVRIISKRERTWPPPAMSPYWRTWMTITQSWQRNCAGCQASPLRATTGGSAWALGEAAMSKAPLQGPERLGDLAHYCQLAKLDSDPRGLAMTSALCDQVQTDNNPAGLLLQNLELLRSCISKRGKVRQDLRPPGAPKLWVQRMGCRGRDKKGRGGRYP
ncbi:uncharacterized protein C22orf15 homolog isoform X1 [Pan paniscus]|uniref:uncharacterized protein C22orf15 homolog isoform X1 n=2 Tax=Pan paniscus TaxID=9597 RepID=UPI0004F09283|nr:uncharacterized protein C22orf15 homolog isoform X1 [Pan paniscus]XP_009436202.1 uncharacterized protein C22orf15 homolog isoform X8 [Pan troglodytes]